VFQNLQLDCFGWCETNCCHTWKSHTQARFIRLVTSTGLLRRIV